MNSSQPVIGLEIHVQLKTESKLFCSCSAASYGAPPNTNICPTCTGQPGALPVLNKKAVEKILTMGLVFDCAVAPYSVFARKNYFYPDLPKNYQISQYELPVLNGGEMRFYSRECKTEAALKRIHLEEDAGKMLHAIGSESLDVSLVDFNRAGIALAETVTQPVLENPQQASDFLTALRYTLRAIDASSCDMEKGEMRVDVNVSLRENDGRLGTKVEIKNLNSFKAVRDALDYEIARQTRAREHGERVIQETRLWDVKQNKTVAMRSKEEASDYRYFPDPDLKALPLDKEWIETLRRRLPPLPLAQLELYQERYGLNLKEAQALIFNEDSGIAALFEQTVALLTGPGLVKNAANWILNDILGALKAAGQDARRCGLTPRRFANFLETIRAKQLSSRLAKDILAELIKNPEATVEDIIVKNSLSLVADDKQLAQLAERVLAENPQAVKEYLQGKEKALQALIGTAMRLSRGQAHPQKMQELLKQALGAKKQ